MSLLELLLWLKILQIRLSLLQFLDDEEDAGAAPLQDRQVQWPVRRMEFWQDLGRVVKVVMLRLRKDIFVVDVEVICWMVSIVGEGGHGGTE